MLHLFIGYYIGTLIGDKLFYYYYPEVKERKIKEKIIIDGVQKPSISTRASILE